MSRRIWTLLISLLLVVSVVAGCGGAAKETKPTQPAAEEKKVEAAAKPAAKTTVYPVTVKDAIGRDVVIPAEPKRILSVTPANTELTFALGKGGSLVGRSDWCDYPEEAKKLPSIGGFQPQPSYEKIVALQPDLVLLTSGSDDARNKLISEYKLNVFVVSPQTFEDAYAGIKTLGVVLNAQEAAEKLVADMQAAVKEVTDKVAKAASKPKVYYEVWDEPLMTAGTGTFINDMINLAGGVNVGAETKGWATINAELVAKANPDIIIASSPMNLEKIQARTAWAGFKAVKDGKVLAVADANHVSRPGPRLVLGLKWFAQTLHPELFK
ncbi:MAG TPA: ABC transporter substrate-binding protein [Symbiobacteriaceae bacterium]|nr:ABC transporter substrate-binding protein [Symbiobacteriaceae bacterium]